MAGLVDCPAEIVSLIVGELAVAGRGPWRGLLRDLKSCSLASRIFLAHTRRHIFSSIVLQPKSNRDMCHSTDPVLKFAQILQHAPEVASHVKELRFNYYHSSPFTLDWINLGKISALLQQFCRVQSLTIRVLETAGYFGWDSVPGAIRQALLNLVGQSTSTLRHLDFNFLGFPFRHPFLLKTRLSEVSIVSLVKWSPTWAPRTLTMEGTEHEPFVLRSLQIQTYDDVAMSFFLSSPSFVDLSRLETLDLQLYAKSQYILSYRLLESCQCLKKLRVNLDCGEDEFDFITVFPIPLYAMDPSCWATLVHLETTNSVYLNEHYPGNLNRLFYGLFDSPAQLVSRWPTPVADPTTIEELTSRFTSTRPILTMFPRLETIGITLHLLGDLSCLQFPEPSMTTIFSSSSVSSTFFDAPRDNSTAPEAGSNTSSWSELDGALSSTAFFPKLRSVVIQVVLEYEGPEEDDDFVPQNYQEIRDKLGWYLSRKDGKGLFPKLWARARGEGSFKVRVGCELIGQPYTDTDADT